MPHLDESRTSFGPRLDLGGTSFPLPLFPTKKLYYLEFCFQRASLAAAGQAPASGASSGASESAAPVDASAVIGDPPLPPPSTPPPLELLQRLAAAAESHERPKTCVPRHDMDPEDQTVSLPSSSAETLR